LGVVDGKDLVEKFGWGRPGPFGLAGDTETKHDGVAVYLHTFDATAERRQVSPLG